MRSGVDLMRRLACLAVVITLTVAASAEEEAPPQTVRFPSANGKTNLVGYLYVPAGEGPHPALVLLHGRSGPYSSLADGVSTVATLSKRHATWAAFWQARGYVALPEHSFDDPGDKRQSRDANRRATEDAQSRAEAFFRAHLGR